MKIDKKQSYHLEPPQGLMNDPNGLVWFRGRYYVFFQWNRFKKDHSHKEWGFFTSKDLVNWEFHGGALQPGEPFDQSGVHSGSALVIDGQLCVFYTGSDKSSGHRRSSQCLAVSSDGQHFRKKGIIMETPPGFTEHFRDPKVFQASENRYFMVVGAQRKNGKGAVALCRSEDGIHWRYSHMLAAAEDYEMVECPDLFCLDGQDILLYCLQKRDNAHDQVVSAHSFYRMTSFDPETGTIPDKDLGQGCQMFDSGFDFFAPQTFEAPDGRRILFAWMSRMDDDQERVFAEEEPGIHCLTLPRELAVRNGRLCQQPVRELSRMLGEEIRIICDGQGQYTAEADTRTCRLLFRAADCPPGLHFELGEASLHWDGEQFVFVRQNWAGSEEIRTCSPGRLDSIEIWSDVSSLEIFINGGEETMSARVFPQTKGLRIIVTDKEKIDSKAIADLDKVKGSFFNSGQYQIILGTGLVNRVYDEVVKITGDPDSGAKGEKEAAPVYGNRLQRAIRMFSDVFVPVIPVLVATGLFMGLRGLLTQEVVLNLLGMTPADIPQGLLIFTQVLTDTAFAFLPALVCWSTFRNFGGSPVIGIVLGLMLVSPSLPSAYDVGSGAAEPLVFFGFLSVSGYQGSVLPAFVTGILTSKFEKWLRRHVPDAVDLIVTPFVTLLVGSVLAMFVIGPVLHMVESGVLVLVENLLFLPLGIGGLLYGCFGQLLGIFGIHHILNFLEISMLAQDGWNYLNPIGTCGNVAQPARFWQLP